MLSEMLVFKVMRLASEPFLLRLKDEGACKRLIKMAQLNTERSSRAECPRLTPLAL